MSADPHAVFMEEAIRLACESVNGGGGPFGCVVVKDGNIIARGANGVTRHFDPTAHAEVVAIRAACRALGQHQLDGCDLYASCEPCPMCLGAIYWSRPRAVYFAATRHDAARAGFDDEFIYRELSLAPEKRKRALVQLSVAFSERPFQAWMARADRIDY